MHEATRLTVEQFIEVAQQHEDKRLELHHGAIVMMSPSSGYNAKIAATIITYINMFVMERSLGDVTGADGGYQLTEDTLFVPDVAFIAKEHIPEDYIPGTSTYYPVPPDLAVEVISPSESSTDVRRKTTTYLEAGTRLVWNVYPNDKTVDVAHLSTEGALTTITLTTNDTLHGGEVLPDFAVAVEALFG